jgi:hypothetical protein
LLVSHVSVDLEIVEGARARFKARLLSCCETMELIHPELETLRFILFIPVSFALSALNARISQQSKEVPFSIG